MPTLPWAALALVQAASSSSLAGSGAAWRALRQLGWLSCSLAGSFAALRALLQLGGLFCSFEGSRKLAGSRNLAGSLEPFL